MKLFCEVPSPIGPLTLVTNGQSLIGLYMVDHLHAPKRSDWAMDPSDPVLREAEAQLGKFFAGKITRFDLPLEPEGTLFQLRCWNELRQIPYGETVSYGEMARRLGNPNGSRAVGAANGQNPISVIVPCHRVIGANGKLVGFGGGLPRKAALLAFERSVCFGESASDFWRESPCDPSRSLSKG